MAIAAQGGPRDLALVFDRAVGDGNQPPSRRAVLLDALLRATERRKVRPDGDLDRLGRWLVGADDVLRATVARAVGTWKVESLRPRLAAIAGAAETPDPVRRAAIDALAQLGGPAGRREIERLAGPEAPASARAMAIGALAAFDPEAGAARAADRLATAVDRRRRRGPARPPPPDARRPGRAGEGRGRQVAPGRLRQAGRARGPFVGRDAPGLIEALTKAGGLSSSRPPTAEEVSALAADVARLGDPARGEAIFRRRELSCLKCHAIAGAGGQVGPGLESVGAAAPVDYLVDSLLNPSKAVKENYNAVAVATADGRVVTGIKVRQTDAELVLRDAEDREVALPLDAIDEQKPAGSLMPAGLTDPLTRGELLDLVRFLSELGKIGAYSVGKDRVARRWRVLEASPATSQALRRFGTGAAAGDVPASLGESLERGWVPAYGAVSGTLPLDALPAIRVGPGGPRLGFARAALDVSTAGPVGIGLDSPAGLSLWVDGSKVEAGPRPTLVLATGTHALTLSVPLDSRREGLRLTLEDVPGSPARAQWVVGK